MAVSRFTIATSAPASVGAIGANIPSGFERSWLASVPSKCVSPPNARVTGWLLPRRGRVVVVVDDGAAVAVGPLGFGAPPARPPSESPSRSATASAAATTDVAIRTSNTTRRTTDQPTEGPGPYDAPAMRRPSLSPEQYRR